jgi:hypothetical protein
VEFADSLYIAAKQNRLDLRANPQSRNNVKLRRQL